MVYYLNRSTDREHLTLARPLARIDWRGMVDFDFLRPMSVLELRGVVVVWFAKGSRHKYNAKTHCDSLRTPDKWSWWTHAGGSPRRVRIWSAANDMDLAMYECSDTELEISETVISNKKMRRKSV